MREHHKDEQHAKGDRRHREEIGGDQLGLVIAKERSPRLRWRPAIALRAMLANRRGGDMETQFASSAGIRGLLSDWPATSGESARSTHDRSMLDLSVAAISSASRGETRRGASQSPFAVG
jgi:hypothetical protein